MRIKMLALSAGPDGVFKVGAVRDLDDADAAPLIDGGYAVSLEDAPSKSTRAGGKKSGGKGKDGDPDGSGTGGTDNDPPPPDGDPK